MRSSTITRLGAGALITLLAGTAAAQVQNGSFESPSVLGQSTYGTNYDYLNGTFGSWTYFGGAGLVNTSQGPTAFNAPSAPDGSQVAFIQMTGSFIDQTLTSLTPGALYTLSFFSAGRQATYSDATLQVSFDDNLIGTYSAALFTPFVAQTATFTATGTTGVLHFVNASQFRTDATVFIDDVSVMSAVPEPSTYALMATGLVALAGIARRRRRA